MSLILLLIVIVVVIAVAAYLLMNVQNGALLDQLANRHVFITGGSKGIGFEMAKIAVKKGAHVTIVARNTNDLEQAKIELIKLSDPSHQKVLAYSVDVAENMFNLERILTEAEDKSGPIYLLACCAGTVIAKTFEDLTTEEFHKQMNINYFGIVNTVKVCLPSLKKNTNKSHVLLFSSLGGVFGMYGYSGYSPTKFAVVGLAQALAMEFKPLNIGVTVSFPPDTDTPGLKEELVDKPQITKIITEEGGLFSAEEVARKSLCDTLNGEFTSTVGFNGIVLTTLCSGTSPTKSWLFRLLQIFSMGILRICMLHFLVTCDKTISKELKKQKDKNN